MSWLRGGAQAREGVTFLFFWQFLQLGNRVWECFNEVYQQISNAILQTSKDVFCSPRNRCPTFHPKKHDFQPRLIKKPLAPGVEQPIPRHPEQSSEFGSEFSSTPG